MRALKMRPDVPPVYRDTLQIVMIAGILLMGHNSFVAVVPASEVIMLFAPFEAPVVVTLAAIPLVTLIGNTPATRSRTVVPSKSANMLMLCAGRRANRKRR